MTETTADVRTIVRRLGLLEERIQELQSLLSSHLVRGLAGAATEHPYNARGLDPGGEPIIKGTRTPGQVCRKQVYLAKGIRIPVAALKGHPGCCAIEGLCCRHPSAPAQGLRPLSDCVRGMAHSP